MATVDLGKVAIKHRGTWDSAASYEALDFVYNQADGCGYIALASNTNVTPGTDATKWAMSVSAGASGQSSVNTKVEHTSSDTVVSNLAWDSAHVFPEMASLSYTFATVPSDGFEHEIVIIFDTPSDITNFTLVSDSRVAWGLQRDPDSAITASTRYEIRVSSASLAGVYIAAQIPSQSE